MSPIYCTIMVNNLEILKELLKLGANPNLTNNIISSFIQQIKITWKNIYNIFLLVKFNKYFGETQVYLCFEIDNYEAWHILLNNNEDCDISKKDVTTSLHLAA